MEKSMSRAVLGTKFYHSTKNYRMTLSPVLALTLVVIAVIFNANELYDVLERAGVL